MTLSSSKKIFLIEDNRTEGMLLKLSLSSIEHLKITIFSKGNDLVDNLALNPDIIIVDLMLPDISGYELIKKIKKFNSKIKIVVVSAQRDIELIAKIQELGVNNYIIKSENCMQYLYQVIKDLILVIDNQ